MIEITLIYPNALSKATYKFVITENEWMSPLSNLSLFVSFGASPETTSHSCKDTESMYQVNTSKVRIMLWKYRSETNRVKKSPPSYSTNNCNVSATYCLLPLYIISMGIGVSPDLTWFCLYLFLVIYYKWCFVVTLCCYGHTT